MINSDPIIDNERWRVLQAINHEYSSREDTEIYLKKQNYYNLTRYIDNVLHWLKNEEIIQIRWPSIGWDYDPIEIRIIDQDRFKEKYENYRERQESIKTDQNGIKAVKMLLEDRIGRIKTLDNSGKVVNECILKSPEAQNLVVMLWGQKKELAMQDSQQIWSKSSKGKKMITDELKINIGRLTTLIDQTNRQFKTDQIPIWIRRVVSQVFLDIRTS